MPLQEIKHRYTGAVIYSCEAETFRECAERAVKEKVSLSEADMRGADMSWADMRGADMREADMRGADMSWADMREANMRGANMSEANMREADMRGADMSEANMREAYMRGADMRGANMSEANMRGADMREADMREADMREADMRGANMDFSCWPLSCNSTHVVASDRLFAQLFFHLTRINVSKCSGGVRESMDELRAMAASDLFCEYRNDVGNPVNEQ